MDEGTDLYTLADIEETDALRAVELVAAGAEHIDMSFHPHRSVQMSKCLNRVRMEQDPVFFRRSAPISRIGWIVPISLLANITADQDGIRADRRLQLIQMKYVRLHPHPGK